MKGMWEADRNALNICSGEELEYFGLGDVVINHTRYTILTGFEDKEHRCFWCGAELKGKAKRYCRGHMTEYYNHFRWDYASHKAHKRADYKCENCGRTGGGKSLEVHHIVPLKGAGRFFTAYNLPWNLIVLCHDCHQEIHAIMRNGHGKLPLDTFELALSKGQLSMELR